ncbi:4-amino-4-deoxy-L-arabinose transferase [Nocardioides sp.]|uniref:4-amino-4-deoxy-L-arabinose transferase n=1 Tax=Nocardioides sp. TaxID=35761 RepID=UPI002ED4466F
MPDLDPTDVSRVLDLALSRPPSLGPGRLVCVDGPAGSGKTTLAEALVRRQPGAAAVHMDDLFEGWDGLPTVDRQLGTLLSPLAQGLEGRYRRWDWHASSWGEQVTVRPVPLLVVEGVGSGSLVAEPFTTVLVWVEAPYDLRMRRGIARDGDDFAPFWERWAAAEALHFATHRTRERADLVVNGAGSG